MGKFQYEWWAVDIIESTGKYRAEVKAKSKENAIAQITKYMTEQNKRSEDSSLPWWERGGKVLEVLWDTLTLDRKGYQRRF